VTGTLTGPQEVIGIITDPQEVIGIETGPQEVRGMRSLTWRAPGAEVARRGAAAGWIAAAWQGSL